MICKWCNKENPNTNQFCMYCGQKLTQDSNNNVNINNNMNNSIENNQYSNNYNQIQSLEPEKKANIGLAILSWFIPLVGLILFIVKREKDPKTAKVSGICALISFILSIVMIIVVTLITSSIINNILNMTKEENEYTNNYYDNNNKETTETNDVDINSNESNSNNNNNTIETTNDWKEYKVTVNDKTLTLPTTYNELSTATSFSLKSADTKSYLEKDYYTLINMYKNEKLALHIEVLNDTEEDKLYTDCKITRISQTKYQVSQGADVISFPGNLKAGEKITEAKIIELLGEPNDVKEYSSDGYESKTYKYYENSSWTTTNHYEITVVNGIIDQLQLDNRN